MIPDPIQHYLQSHQVPFLRHWHPRAVTAQELAEALHVTGYRVAKSVIAHADGQLHILVIPATETVDFEKAQQVLGARQARLATEDEFANRFPDCELGAEPPFGKLYGLPVVVDERLAEAEDLLLRAGSHEEALEVGYQDFLALEQPRRASLIQERPESYAAPHELHP